MLQNHLSRIYFLSKGCKQVPLDYTRGIVRWAHPGGYFLNAKGQKVKETFSPSNRNIKTTYTHGGAYPTERQTGGKTCHLLMALAFYGDRPSDPTNGKPCVCHHLIPDRLDYKPANLLCWLTRAEHAKADRRQRTLRKIVPDLHDLSYEKHRRLQDPRITSDEVFERYVQLLKNVF